MKPSCTSRGCLCTPSEPLQILGAGIEGDRLWFGREDDNWATYDEIAAMRKRVAISRGGNVAHFGTFLDEADVTLLIKAMEEHVSGVRVLPLFPLEICHYCGADAVASVEGYFMCHNDAEGFRFLEEESER